MKITTLCKRILIPLFLPYTLFIGCSVVGAIAGGASHPAREGKITSTLGLDSIDRGTDIRLVRFDRTVLEGTFNGLEVYPGKMYARTYDTLVARCSYKGFIPGLNQRITLKSLERLEEGYFKGIDRGQVLFQPESDSDTLAVSLDEIEWLQASDSSRLNVRMAKKLVREGSMPGREIILLEVNREERHVPYESIEMVEVRGTGSGALTGFLIGAAVDITAVILIVSAERESEAECNRTASGSGNQSCTSSHR
jgi:hypothetical protein